MAIFHSYVCLPEGKHPNWRTHIFAELVSHQPPPRDGTGWGPDVENFFKWNQLTIHQKDAKLPVESFHRNNGFIHDLSMKHADFPWLCQFTKGYLFKNDWRSYDLRCVTIHDWETMFRVCLRYCVMLHRFAMFVRKRKINVWNPWYIMSHAEARMTSSMIRCFESMTVLFLYDPLNDLLQCHVLESNHCMYVHEYCGWLRHLATGAGFFSTIH